MGEETTPRSMVGKFDFYTLIAIVMAIVGTLGAGAAYWAAQAEQEVARLERMLAQGRMIELHNRQEQIDKYVVKANVETHRDDNNEEARRQLDAGKRYRAENDTRNAVSSELSAQEALTLARLWGPMNNFFASSTGKGQLELDFHKPGADELGKLGFDIDWNEPRGVAEEQQFPNIWDRLESRAEDALGSLDSRIEEALRSVGFDVHWNGPHTVADSVAEEQQFPNIWKRLELRIDHEREKINPLTGSVTAFVLALVFFTLSALNTPRRSLAWTGVGIALIALGTAAWTNRDAFLLSSEGLRITLLSGIGFAVIGLIAWRLSSMCVPEAVEEENETLEPGEFKSERFQGLQVYTRRAKHTLHRGIVVLVAGTAFLSAVTFYLYSRAEVQSEANAAQALKHEADMIKAGGRTRAAVYHVLQTSIAAAQEQQARVAAELQFERLAESKSLNIETSDFTQHRRHLDTWKNWLESDAKDIAGVREMLSGEGGPERDEYFPERFVYDRTIPEAQEAFALWDEVNELNLAWHHGAVRYLATLTIFAIALYLFGQALGMTHLRPAFLLSFFSLCLTGIGIAQALNAGSEPLPVLRNPEGIGKGKCSLSDMPNPSPSQTAAWHFAYGQRDIKTAHEPDEYRAAAARFECALNISPSFAFARYYYARVAEDVVSPQMGESYGSLFSRYALIEAVDQEKAAIKDFNGLGLRPSMQTSGYAFDLLALALDTEDRQLLEKSIEVGREAVDMADDARYPSAPHRRALARFNLALALLIAGKESGTVESEYAKALTLMGDKYPDLALSAITDLEVWRAYCKWWRKDVDCLAQDKTIQNLKERIVQAAWPAPSGAASPGEIADVGLEEMTPARVGWRARLKPGLQKNDLVVVWYFLQPRLKTWQTNGAISSPIDTWQTIGAISGPIDPSELKRGGDGWATYFRSYLNAKRGHACLEGGDYKAEFYIKGRLVATQAGKLYGERFHGAAFPQLNLAACYPEAWKKLPSGLEKEPALRRGIVDKTLTNGLFLFSFYYPHDAASQAQAEAGFIQQAIREIGVRALMPPWMLKAPSECERSRQEPGVIFSEFDSPWGRTLAKAWIAPEGMVHVGVIVKSAAEFSENAYAEPCALLHSIENIEVAKDIEVAK